MYVVSVTIYVKGAFVRQFVEATMDNARNTRKEAGRPSAWFDVAQAEEDKSQFLLYEAYRGKDDFLAHQQTEHYLRWKAAVADWMARPRQGVKHVGTCSSAMEKADVGPGGWFEWRRNCRWSGWRGRCRCGAVGAGGGGGPGGAIRVRVRGRIVFGRGQVVQVAELAAQIGRAAGGRGCPGQRGEGGAVDRVADLLAAAGLRAGFVQQGGEPTVDDKMDPRFARRRRRGRIESCVPGIAMWRYSAGGSSG